MIDNKIIGRIRGCLYGQAIGDALGFGTEIMSKKDIEVFYPDKLRHYDDIYQDERRQGWPKGMWTDDTEMMLSVMDCIINNPSSTITPDVLAPYFLSFYDQWGHTCGILTRKVLNFAPPVYMKDPIAVSKKVWELKGKNNAPNGGLMRTSIIGVWPYNVVENATNVCRMTHFDSRCVCSCIIVCKVIHDLVWENKITTADELYETCNSLEPECGKWIASAYNNKEISELMLDDDETSAYTYRTLSAAMWAYFHAPDFESGLLEIVNEGGDADTNAAVACAILGAKFGFSAIPSEYVDGLYHRTEFDNKINEFIRIIETNSD